MNRHRPVRRGVLVMASVAVLFGATAVGCSTNESTTPPVSSSSTTTTTTGATTTTAAAATTTSAAPVAPGAVTIVDYAFSPKERTAKVGEAITWTNKDEAAHRVVTDEGTELDSGDIEPGKAFEFTFAKPGTYAYHCFIHNIMKGTVVVT